MKVKLEMLSPTHIGSGTQYQGNAEYLYFEQEKTVVIIDEAKVLDIIGEDNIHIWVKYIEDRENKQNFLEYLRIRKPKIRPEDVALRVIPLVGGRAPYFTNTLREQMHGGMSVPYLPGSSLKGAIRTAIFAHYLMKNYDLDGVPEGKLGVINRNGKFDYKDKLLQSEVFGHDPNSDWMRLIQVGDCYFQTGTKAAFAETLNERGAPQQYEIKEAVRQLIEFIPAGKSAEFQINIPKQHRDLIFQKMPYLLNGGAKKLEESWLCKLVHAHTLRLLEDEITFFRDADLPVAAEGLPDFMNDLLREAKTFDENACLLRLGFGTGYRSMTGHWAKDLVTDDNLYDDIATATRRTPKYNGLPLPKSRKIMFDGTLMGYVKLTFNS